MKWVANITIASSCDNDDAVTDEKQMQPFMVMNGSGEEIHVEMRRTTGKIE
jgi:hypothetical protein